MTLGLMEIISCYISCKIKSGSLQLRKDMQKMYTTQVQILGLMLQIHTSWPCELKHWLQYIWFPGSYEFNP